MVVDVALTARLRAAIGDDPRISEKKMFGGVCILLDGNMVGGAHRDKVTGSGRFMFRVGKDNAAAAAALPGAEPMIHGGRRMGGFYYLDETAATDEVLAEWAALALRHVRTLPPKGAT
ncbi:TfoX/Sxy family protein [Tropicimonas marinistellae]|uniref:TfoX/Sxy family protein n=1 Tax=Tropicimonas marinistellae TaxID=1739787 RepID=UPI0008300870|nr:TfoX/Sxy family protein [Tropicimonas marinistellae]